MKPTVLLLSLLLSTASAAPLRGLWVDAFGPGFKTEAEIQKLVQDARTMGLNTLFAQVVRRADCYCLKSTFPVTEDPEVPQGFDPLAVLIREAHKANLQVHAWVIIHGMTSSEVTPPKNPAHPINAHGLDEFADTWLTFNNAGEAFTGRDYYFDLAHPGVVKFFADGLRSLAQNYDLDGIMLDRIRYPDPVKVSAPIWGYNPYSLSRYFKETGATQVPEPQDVAWTRWRRDQVSLLVKNLYLQVKTVKPRVWFSASTITYGPAPKTSAEFKTTRTYNEVLQDWPLWLKDGYLELNVMMNYKRQNKAPQDQWYAGWVDFARQQAGVNASGIAWYLNTFADIQAQTRKAQSAGMGWAGYSYRFPSLGNYTSNPTVTTEYETLKTLLPSGGPFDVAPLPVTSIRGQVAGKNASGVPIEVWQAGRMVARTVSDATGFFGLTRLPSGKLEIRVLKTRKTMTLQANRIHDVGVF
ncbi:family 10 glycosylhydrolase [Deinococcus misasensis]|uniref:family 10 glycosylhydrolase n=1 Tax=Deinococcus misasensis TaxID=392413 RepID=UPI00068DB6A2|nr:family 10 glycosylhydrolase [Deinococcus misasensis]